MMSGIRDMRLRTDQPLFYLYAIIGLSIALRVTTALWQGNTIEPLPGVYDQLSYDSLARRVLSGHGFSFGVDWWPATKAGEPTAHWSFLYTLYLAATYKIFGLHPIAPRLLQAIAAGALLPWLTWRLGKRVACPSVALIAATLTSVYGYYIFYAGALMTESFFIVAVLWALDTAIRIRTAKIVGSWLWLQFGLALGVAVLLRQVFLPVVPLLFGWLFCAWIVGRSGPVLKRKTVGGALVAILMLAAMILPWSVRNYKVFGQFCLLNTSAGFAFYWGNHPIHGGSFIPILPPGGPSYGELLPEGITELNEVALEKALLAKGIAFVMDDPKRFFLLSLSRTVEYFKFWPTSESSIASNIVRTLSFGALLPFVVLGMWLFAAHSGGEQQILNAETKSLRTNRRWDIGLLTMFAVSYTLIHLLSWTLVRYRLPVDAVLMIPAAVGMLAVFDRCRATLGASKHSTKAAASCLEEV